jgi:hypothetical protein
MSYTTFQYAADVVNAGLMTSQAGPTARLSPSPIAIHDDANVVGHGGQWRMSVGLLAAHKSFASLNSNAPGFAMELSTDCHWTVALDAITLRFTGQEPAKNKKG